MKSGVSPKSIAILFFVILGLYLAGFYGFEHMRHKGGPWKVTFISSETGRPSLLINQDSLNLTNIQIVFLGSNAPISNLNEQVSFDLPQKPLPFGKRIHEDIIYLPGVQNLHLFGHQVELFPRTLRIDGQEHPWTSGQTIELQPRPIQENAPPPPVPY